MDRPKEAESSTRELDPAPVVPLTHRQILVVFSGLIAGMLLAALDQTIVSTALPTIVSDLGGLDHLSWVVTSYLLTSTVVLPMYGKLGDSFGRRQVFQAAILIFVGGSILSGLSQSMLQLILFRGLQGLGAGGLMALAMAVIGDIVSPRELGRYMGYLIAVFALASVSGPLAGGFLVDHLSWRWIFYINVPFGALAIALTSFVLRLPFRRIPHRVDVGGAVLLGGSVTCVLLVSAWGGNAYPWLSSPVVGMAIASVVLLGLFLRQERRAAEPILPLRLFSSDIFAISAVLSFFVGAAMFGALVFLPLFLQAVTGATATNSGLLMFPLMAGLMATSVLSGRVISRTGYYRSWPILGMGLSTVGMILLSRMNAETSRILSSIFMVILGMGIGMVMQVLILAVQNAVPQGDLGVATSAVNFFQQVGATLGVSVFGAIFAARMHVEVGRLLPGRTSGVLNPERLATSPAQIRALPAGVRGPLIEALSRSIHTVFIWCVPVMVIGFGLSWLIRQIPLRATVHVGQTQPSELL